MQLGDLVPADVAMPTGAANVNVVGLTADSRAVAPGFLFAALAGTATDGARFVADAVRRGAVAILAGSDADIASSAGVPVLRAADPRRAPCISAETEISAPVSDEISEISVEISAEISVRSRLRTWLKIRLRFR